MIASANGIKTGATCKKLRFLPGECSDQFQHDVATWSRQLGAVTGPEIALVETAVYCQVKQRRARNALGAAGTETIEHLADDYHDRTADEIRAILPQLPVNPGGVVQVLRKSSQGCAYLLYQFSLLRDRLRTHASFEVSQRSEFLLWTGSRPVDLFRDASVFDLDRLYLGALGGPGSFTAAEAANALLHDRPEEMSEEEFERRLEPMVQDLPTVAEGHAALVALVEEQMAELTERIALVKLREERDLELADDKARDDVSSEGEKHHRHDVMATRGMNASFRELRGMIEMRYKHGSGDPEESDESEDLEPAGEPHDEVPPAAADADTPASQEPAQCEATVPQVESEEEEVKAPFDVNQPVSPWESNGAPGAASPGRAGKGRVRASAPPSATASPGVIPDSPEEDEAIRAAYRARLERVFERLDQDEGTGQAELDAAARASPPPGAESQENACGGPIEENRCNST
jgi:hypothetical protein